jgi:hypothetical protein
MRRYLFVVTLLAATVACGAIDDLLNPNRDDFSSHYDVQPDVAACSAGTLKEADRQAALTALNDVRGLHALPPVSYESSWDDQVTGAALIMAANGALSHAPSSDWSCWSQAGYDGAAASNLSIRTGATADGSDRFIYDWLTDVGDTAGGIGHRQWILYPFLSKVAFGRVDGTPINGDRVVTATALRVIGATQSASSMEIDYVAYPVREYPAWLVDVSYWLSFSPIASIDTPGGANVAVDLSAATVSMTGDDGSVLAITATAYENSSGAPLSAFRWKAAGIVAGRTYTVTVSACKVNGVYKSYTYTFKLV